MILQRRYLILYILGTSLASLIFAYISEHFFGLRPCALCYYQRYFFWGIAGVSGLIYFILSFQGMIWSKMSLFALYLGNLGVAFYQVLVEYHFIPEPRICQRPSIDFGSTAQVTEQLLQLQPVSCAEVAWSFFGISMAGYNVLYSLFTLSLMIYFQKKGCR